MQFTNADEKLVELFQQYLPDGYSLRKTDPLSIDYRVIYDEHAKGRGLGHGTGHLNPFKDELRRLGLWMKYSHEKFVPDLYKYNTSEIRRELLRGILDADGFVNLHGQPALEQTSLQLSEDVTWLVRSLGGYTHQSRKHADRSERLIAGRPMRSRHDRYRLSIVYDDGPSLFRYQEKRLKCRRRIKKTTRKFRTIERVRKEKTQCISVEGDLYITDGFIVTHNTMKELRRLAWEGNLIPTQRFFSEALEGSLLPDFEESPEQFRVVFDRSDVEALKDSENELNERLATAVKGGYMQIAEAREEKGLEVTDADRIYLRPIAMIEIPAGEPRPVLPEKGRKIAADPEPLLPEDAPPRRQPNAMQRRVVEMNERNHTAFSAQFQKELERFFDGLGKDASRIAREVLKSAKPGSTKDLAEEIEGQRILDEMALEIAQRALQQKGGRHYLRVAQETFNGVSAILELEIGMPDPVAREIVAKGGTRMGLIDLRKQTRERLFRELTEGRAAGEGIPQLVTRIRDKIPAGRYQDAATRAKVIARTETKHAQRTSVLRAYKESQVVTRVLVLDDRLGHGDADCTFWNGREVPLDQAAELASQEHPNGTRDFAPVIP